MSKIDPKFSKITPEIVRLAQTAKDVGYIDPALYEKYHVKRGLRDINGQGVLTGLTEIAEVHSYSIVDAEYVPCEGRLFYRGIDIEEMVDSYKKNNSFGFEETTYLLMFGLLPSKEELEGFKQLLNEYRVLPTGFVRDVILKAPSRDVMNSLARSVLTLYSYDANADDTSVENVLRQSLQLIATFPMLALYSYQAFKHYHDFGDLLIRTPNPEYTTAQNILTLLRPDGKFTDIEAKALDLCLVIHADHGGGNNSAFTTHVVTSTGTDTYSAIAAALGSLKGPRHGGANIKVVKMMDDIKEHLTDWEDEEAIKGYLADILDKKAFDKSGLIYGVGHAVYSLSDPRSKVLKGFVEKLAEENGMSEEFRLYSRIEKLAPELIMERRKVFKGVCVNVDFYSGFVYKMLGLPSELFTPIFAIARISGWCAHRVEEIVNMGKIIRPAYKNVAKHKKYVPMDERD